MRTRKSWREKMENPKRPKVIPVPVKMRKRLGDGTMLVPSPREVEDAIRRVPAGSTITVSQIRELLADEHGAAVACPLATGIFVRLAAEAAAEDARNGKKDITPYWRLVGRDGSLNPKFPGGVDGQAERLRAEGHRILPGRRGRPPRVALPSGGALSRVLTDRPRGHRPLVAHDGRL